MKFIRKKAWPVWGMILLALFNVLIIIASTKIPELLWLLAASIPLFLISTYSAWQTGHLPQKSSADILEPAVKPIHFEWLSHSVYPTKITSADLKVLIGNDQCSQPYKACIFNVDSMLNADHESIFLGAPGKREPERSGYPAGERFEAYHLAAGGLMLQTGPGNPGHRTEIGHFNSKAFKNIACRPEVKMIGLKLSSSKNTAYPADSSLHLAQPPDHTINHSTFSCSALSIFSGAEGMIHFLNHLRELADGKPVGIRICINDKKEFYQICYAIQKTQLIPDFIVVEGSFDSGGSVHSNLAFHAGLPLYEALLFVSQTLQLYGLENKIRIIADGRINSCFDILKVLALGANVVYTEMPRYTAVKHPGDGRKLSLHYSSQTVHDFHDNLLKDTVQLMKVCGFKNVSDITLPKFFSRLDVLHSKIFEEPNGPVLYPGSVKKIYTSKAKTHRTQGERKKVSLS